MNIVEAHKPYRNLKAEMVRKDLHQKDIAEVIGCSISSASKKINGRMEFTKNEATRLTNLFQDCSFEYLFS